MLGSGGRVPAGWLQRHGPGQSPRALTSSLNCGWSLGLLAVWPPALTWAVGAPQPGAEWSVLPLADVKPSNVLINKEGHVKMCDFGISGYLVDSVAKTMDAGCKPYMAVSGSWATPGGNSQAWPPPPRPVSIRDETSPDPEFPAVGGRGVCCPALSTPF